MSVQKVNLETVERLSRMAKRKIRHFDRSGEIFKGSIRKRTSK